jgi:hypothetical protein
MLMPATIIRHVRQNHALEHATVHLLSRAYPGVRLVGRSDARGFTLVGELETAAVRRAVDEGLQRLNGHEPWLATHPLCGTNLAAAAVVLGSAAWAASLLPTRSRGLRLLRGALAMGVVWPLAQQAGPLAQEHLTTTPEVLGARVVEVRSERRGPLLVHRVLLAHDR